MADKLPTAAASRLGSVSVRLLLVTLALCNGPVATDHLDVTPPVNQTSLVGRPRPVRSGDADAYIIELGAGRRIPPSGSGGGGAGLAAEAAAAAGVRRLSPDVLLVRMGADFDGARMSIERPTVFSWTSNGSSDTDRELIDDVRRLSFSYRDEAGELQTLRPVVVRQLERWLVEQARCPVRFTWEDMGTLFWPRWVRHGRCDAATSCSWPPGMHCAPAESDAVRLLHWQCRRAPPRRRRRVSRRHATVDSSPSPKRAPRRRRLRPERALCRWRKVPYSVTSECFCSC